MFKVLGNFFQRSYPCIFVVIVNGLCTTVYKKTDEQCIEWQQVTTNDNKWYNELQQVTASGTTNEKGTIHFKGMDDCHPYYDKNRYTTSRYG